MTMYRLYLFVLLLCTQPARAQLFRRPFDFPMLLSANFGELRGNHFHSSIDHPDGTTTVYGHLQRFAPDITAYVEEQREEITLLS